MSLTLEYETRNARNFLCYFPEMMIFVKLPFLYRNAE